MERGGAGTGNDDDNDNHQVQGGAGAGNGWNEERSGSISRLAQADQTSSLPFPGKDSGASGLFIRTIYETYMRLLDFRAIFLQVRAMLRDSEGSSSNSSRSPREEQLLEVLPALLSLLQVCQTFSFDSTLFVTMHLFLYIASRSCKKN